MGHQVLTDEELIVLGERKLQRSSNFSGIKLTAYLKDRIPSEYEWVKHFFDSNGIVGAMYINAGNKIVQVIDVGTFQIVEA